MSNFHPLVVVDRGSETQLQVGENFNLAVKGLVNDSCKIIRCAVDRLRNKVIRLFCSMIYYLFYNDIFTSHWNNALTW